jgi:dienelactone hydrolase
MASIRALATAVLLATVTPVLVRAPAAAAGPLAPVAEQPQKVQIPASAECKLSGSYWAPKDAKGEAPAVLMVHDAAGDRRDLVEFGERLAKQGFAVLSFDLRGHGESRGQEKAWADLNEVERKELWQSAKEDVRACSKWLREQKGVNDSKMSLLGDRAGCGLVLAHARSDEFVCALVLLDPTADQLGFNPSDQITQIAGLPTYIAVTKESQPKAQVIAASGEKANAGAKFVEIAVFKGAAVMPVSDKSMFGGIGKFLSAKAMPKKAE